MSKHYTVTPHQQGWAVKRDGAERASLIRSTQKAAIDAGKPLARESKGELRIQRTDARFREAYSYGNDPYPPKG